MMNTFAKTPPGALYRVARYSITRAVTLIVSVVISVFMTIYIANLGGYLDTITKALISENISGMLSTGWLKDKTREERQPIIEQTRWEMEESSGLHKPFMQRCLDWLYRGLTLDWGPAKGKYEYASGKWSADIRMLIEKCLPRTLLLLGTSNLAILLVSVWVAVLLVRHPGSWFDRLMVTLTPVSAAPSWVIGILLFVLSYRFGVFSFNLGYDKWPSVFTAEYLPIVLRNMVLPFLAIFLSKFFQSVYSWRTFFLIYSKEYYMDLAKAKGLPNSRLERQYILRPALPGVLTNFALVLISLWQESIIIESFFKLRGIGWFFSMALARSDITSIVALVVTFAYFLAITVFILDVVYALVDPRVKIGGEAKARIKGSFSFRLLRENISAALGNLWSGARQHRLIASAPRESFSDTLQHAVQTLTSLGLFFRQVLRYPSAVIGITIITVLSILSAYTVITIPYEKVVRLWRSDDQVWYRNPAEAPPAWTNWFRKDKLPETIVLNSQNASIQKTFTTNAAGQTEVNFTFQFDYSYDTYPQDIVIYFTSQYTQHKPFVSLTWRAPDGRETVLKRLTTKKSDYYHVAQDKTLVLKLKEKTPAKALFLKPVAQTPEILKGRYELQVQGLMIDPGSSFDAELVIYGKVHGWTGTDDKRRDLSLVLLWGSGIALSFGILATAGTTFSTITLAAVSAWFGGWVDELVQRFTEINMVLPVLPTSIMIFVLYSKSFWAILGVTILLNIFGSSIKYYRSMFLQVKETPYIEAARTYGAGDWRIIFQYMIPRIRTVLIPQLVILVPSYVFLEATLAMLDVSDPVMPTLGKLLSETINLGLFSRSHHLALESLGILLLIAFGFALLGFALERMYNDREGI